MEVEMNNKKVFLIVSLVAAFVVVGSLAYPKVVMALAPKVVGYLSNDCVQIPRGGGGCEDEYRCIDNKGTDFLQQKCGEIIWFECSDGTQYFQTIYRWVNIDEGDCSDW